MRNDNSERFCIRSLSCEGLTNSSRVNSQARVETPERAITPVALARRILFEPVAQWLATLEAQGLPDVAQLNRWLCAMDPPPCSANGRRLQFVLPDTAVSGYEERVFADGAIVTRPNNWHDLFNALVWMRFPQTKAALNALHVRIMRSGKPGNGRGPIRDAATQFDESGIIVASANPHLLDLLLQRRWKELFWVRRAEVIADMRFLVFGHGLYDALRAPFYLMCGRAATLEVARQWIESDIAAQCRHIDARLADRFADGRWYPRPRSLLALPLLGIPGVTAANESPAYYDDTAQFRPPPAWLA